jgi:hypothetical protein
VTAAAVNPETADVTWGMRPVETEGRHMSHEPQIRKFTCRCTRLGSPGEFAAEVRAQVSHDLLMRSRCLELDSWCR